MNTASRMESTGQRNKVGQTLTSVITQKMKEEESQHLILLCSFLLLRTDPTFWGHYRDLDQEW